MKVRIHDTPIFSTTSFKNNYDFFGRIIYALTKTKNEKNIPQDIHLLFAEKITKPDIEFNYGFIPKKLIVFWCDILILSVKMDTSFLKEDNNEI